MKSAGRILVWIIISLALQSIFFLFIDKVYLNEEKNVKVTRISKQAVKKNPLPKVTFTMGAYDISLSYDGTYTSYFDEYRNLVIIETYTGRPLRLETVETSWCLSCKWLPDANIAIIAMELKRENGNEIRFYSYDAARNIKEDIGDPEDYSSAVPVRYNESKVQIEVSPLTGVLYAKISDKYSDRVYRFDRNERMTRIALRTLRIGKMLIASHDDIIAYEDLIYKRIRVAPLRKSLYIKVSPQLSLLGADAANNIYAGTVDKDRITGIYFGKLSEDTELWKYIPIKERLTVTPMNTELPGLPLESPQPMNTELPGLPLESPQPNNIIISQEGKLYVNIEGSKLVDIITGAEYYYTGSFIGIYSGKIASIVGNSLVMNKMLN